MVFKACEWCCKVDWCKKPVDGCPEDVRRKLLKIIYGVDSDECSHVDNQNKPVVILLKEEWDEIKKLVQTEK